MRIVRNADLSFLHGKGLRKYMGVRVIVVTNDFKLKTIIADELKKNPDFEVRTNALDIFQASNLLLANAPNVVLLDIENQRVTDVYLKSLVEKYNLLFIIIGSVNAANFIKNGITSIMQTPLTDNHFSMSFFITQIRTTIDLFIRNQTPSVSMSLSGTFGTVGLGQKIIVIAASTGGTEALPVVLRNLPMDIAPILIVQHMPQVFTGQFADRLDRLSKISVKEASSGDFLKKGLALLAPGDFHMLLTKRGNNLAVDCVQTERMYGVRPAADVLFQSVLKIVGGNVIGVILTGMGSDGARGLLDLHNKGAKVIGQDKDSCVVYGMPKVAYDMGAVDYQLPLDKIGEKILELARN